MGFPAGRHGLTACPEPEVQGIAGEGITGMVSCNSEPIKKLCSYNNENKEEAAEGEKTCSSSDNIVGYCYAAVR